MLPHRGIIAPNSRYSRAGCALGHQHLAARAWVWSNTTDEHETRPRGRGRRPCGAGTAAGAVPKLRGWLGRFADNVLYFMPRRKNVPRREAHRELTPLGDLAILEEDMRYLEMRVARLNTGMA